MQNSVFNCSIVELPRIFTENGNITSLNNLKEIPFNVKRVYYLYDIPGGESRGGHAHYKLEQYIIAASGSFDVLLDDGLNKRTLSLNRPYYALHIKTGIWRELLNFSSGAICLTLASNIYDECDYIRNYEAFLKEKNAKNKG